MDIMFRLSKKLCTKTLYKISKKSLDFKSKYTKFTHSYKVFTLVKNCMKNISMRKYIRICNMLSFTYSPYNLNRNNKNNNGELVNLINGLYPNSANTNFEYNLKDF